MGGFLTLVWRWSCTQRALMFSKPPLLIVESLVHADLRSIFFHEGTFLVIK